MCYVDVVFLRKLRNGGTEEEKNEEEEEEEEKSGNSWPEAAEVTG